MTSPPDQAAHHQTPAGKPRARALSIPFGGRPGRWNAITDVPGVEVGYVTLIEGDRIRTGVTGIHPRGPAGSGDPVAAGFHAQNGNGEMTGVSWISESGTFTGPIAITNTHAAGAALDAPRAGPVEEGSVGGGTGMNCYQFKGGSGTASRLVAFADTDYTVGVFVQANFGARHELMLAGVPLGAELAGDNPMADFRFAPGAGSVIAV